jgi:hypothetical protein
MYSCLFLFDALSPEMLCIGIFWISLWHFISFFCIRSSSSSSFVVLCRTSFLSISLSLSLSLAYYCASSKYIKYFCSFCSWFDAAATVCGALHCLPYVLCVIVIELYSAKHTHTHIHIGLKPYREIAYITESHNDRINYCWPRISAYFLCCVTWRTRERERESKKNLLTLN